MPTTWNDLLKPGEASDFFSRALPPFDPAITQYNATNARWLAELCRLVYRDADRSEFLRKAGLEELRFFSAKGTQAFLVRATSEPRFAAMVFRGTDDLNAWVTNLMFWKTPLGHGSQVHQGFQDALDAIWPDVRDALDNVGVPFFFAGHSLGGALATLAAARRQPRALYTFGSPYVGNRTFVEALARIPIHRVVDAHDIVPTVPPAELGYAHVGELHVLKEPKEIFKFDSLEKFRALVERAVEPPEFLADHAPINYVSRI
jgi:triacylglycerol lipase